MSGMNSGWRKIAVGAVVVALLIALAVFFPNLTSVDLSHLRWGLRPVVEQDQQQKPTTASGSRPGGGGGEMSEEDAKFFAKRGDYQNEVRASRYLDSATKDYFAGSYDEALRRLERAKWYDPSNFGVFKLSGQIFFEKSRYRRAFNDWAHATQLPNDDQTLLRDLDVLKRLIRYCRTELDRLQYLVNRNPEDRLSAARLRELEEKLQE